MFWLPVKRVFFFFFNFSFFFFFLLPRCRPTCCSTCTGGLTLAARSLFPLWSGTTVKLNDRTLKCWQVFPAAFARRIFFFFPGNSGSDWQAYLPTKLCKRRFPLYQNAPKIWVGGYYKCCVSLSSRRTVIVFGNLPHTPIPKPPVPAVTELGGTPCSSRIRSRCGPWIKSCST